MKRLPSLWFFITFVAFACSLVPKFTETSIAGATLVFITILIVHGLHLLIEVQESLDKLTKKLENKDG